MIQRGIAFLTLFVLLLPSPLFSLDTTTLSQARYWQQLLHFRDGKSEIDSPDFFLSPKGKTDAKAELEATLYAVHHDKSVFCKFPARVKWLYEKIPSLDGDEACPALENLIENYHASKAVLVFPTAHINSPASMFGHTFLRIDDEKGRALTANAVNYAAKTAENNGFLFAYNGLFGGYEGRYSVLPYYKKIKEYNNLERRDIWEYTLNLKKEELTRLLTHLYELKDVYADYYFLTENCSYNLLWLLEVARADTHLVEQFTMKAIPVDTIRAVKKAGFITVVGYRPSKTKRIKVLMREEEKATGTLKKAYKAELGVELLQLKRTQGKIEKKPYVKALMARLAKRSKLPTLPKIDIQRPANPLSSHKTARVALAMRKHQEIALDIKPAFHDIYDVEKGFIQGAYIDFLHLTLAKEKGESIKFKKLDLLSINSYAPRDAIFSPISWGVAVGVESFKEKKHFKLNAEVGLSYGYGEHLFGFIMMKPSLYVRQDAVIGTGPKLGIIGSFSTIKVGVLAEKSFYSDGEYLAHAEGFATIMIAKNTALNIKIDNDKIQNRKSEQSLSASLFYYF